MYSNVLFTTANLWYPVCSSKLILADILLQLQDKKLFSCMIKKNNQNPTQTTMQKCKINTVLPFKKFMLVMLVVI